MAKARMKDNFFGTVRYTQGQLRENENENEGGWSIFYSIQDNEMKRCQGLTLDKMNQVDKKLSPISHVTVNEIKFPYFPLG